MESFLIQRCPLSEATVHQCISMGQNQVSLRQGQVYTISPEQVCM